QQQRSFHDPRPLIRCLKEACSPRALHRIHNGRSCERKVKRRTGRGPRDKSCTEMFQRKVLKHSGYEHIPMTARAEFSPRTTLKHDMRAMFAGGPERRYI